MPTYEYKCESCDYMFEEFQSIHDEPIKVCPKCGGPVRKLISSSYGVIFKGSGFYITDYKHKNSSPSSNGNGNGKADSGKNGTDSKPAAAQKPVSKESK
ncbi:MAG: zinc ribbon domain-containing protein [Calditrichaeota bacterium]|nr:zinc ribbon domain-containing protein [Calditrichota bacterium]